MLLPVLAIVRGRAAAAPRMMCEITGISDYPTPQLSPADVVASQIAALQAEDGASAVINLPSPPKLTQTHPSCRQTRAPSDSRRQRESVTSGS